MTATGPLHSFDLHRIRSRASGAVRALPAVAVAPDQAVGSLLAEDIHALADLPPFDTADVGGWAVSGPGPWTLRDGHDHAPLPDGQATLIEVGAALPANSTGVLARAAGTVCAGRLSASGQHPGHLPVGANTRLRAEEAAAGQTLALAGERVTPIRAGLAAAAGHDEILVTPGPTAGLYVVTDDVVSHGTPTRGRLRDAVGPLVPGWVAHAGGRAFPTTLTPAADLAAEISDSAADIVLVAGADGPAGALTQIAAELSAEPVVLGAGISPGASMALYLLPDGRPLVSLPNDAPGAVAAMICLVQPVVTGLAGAPVGSPRSARLLDACPAGPGSIVLGATLLDGGLFRTADVLDAYGRPRATLQAMAAADALAVVPPTGATAGQFVEFVELP